MKSLIKKIFELLGISEKASSFFINRKYKSYYPLHKEDLKFYRSLGQMKMIFDIGANKGNKTNIFKTISEKVVCIDPDEKNFKILNSRFGTNNKVEILNIAVSDKEGKENFFLLDDGEELNTMSVKWKRAIEATDDNRFGKSRAFVKSIVVETTTLDALIKKYGRPDYIKVDVEGYEIKVLSGLNQPVPLLSFESNLPEFFEETILCIDKLDSIKKESVFNFSVDCKMEYKEWMNASEIKDKIQQCAPGTIEVYCKTF